MSALDVLFVLSCLALFLVTVFIAIRDRNNYAEEQYKSLRGLIAGVTQEVGRVNSELDEHIETTMKQLTSIVTKLAVRPETEYREVALIGPIEVRLLRDEVLTQAQTGEPVTDWELKEQTDWDPEAEQSDGPPWGSDVRTRKDDDFTADFEAEMARLDAEKEQQRREENEYFLERVNQELQKSHKRERKALKKTKRPRRTK